MSVAEAEKHQIILAAYVFFMMVANAGITLICDSQDFVKQLIYYACGIVFAVISYFLKEKHIYRVAFPIFGALLLILTYQLVYDDLSHSFNYYNRWIHIFDVTIKTSALLPLMVFAIAKVITLYRKYSMFRIIGIFTPVMFCLMLVSVQNNLYPVLMSLMAAYIVFAKMHFDKIIEEKSIFYLISIVIVVSAIVVATQIPELSTYMSDRIQVILTRGKNDPMGAGWLRTLLDGIMRETPLFGATNYEAGLNGGTIGEYLHNIGNHNIVIVLAELGWIPFIVFIIGYIGFLFMLYYMTSKTNQSAFAKYVSFILSTIFTVKVVCCLTGFFFLDSAHTEMPFMSSSTDNCVDLVSLGIILGLYRTRNEPTEIIQTNKEWKLSDEIRFYIYSIIKRRKINKKRNQEIFSMSSEYFRQNPKKEKQNKAEAHTAQNKKIPEQKASDSQPAQNTQIKYAFMSYSSNNQKYADKIEDILKKNKIYVWRDSKGIHPGERYAEKLVLAIEKCSCFILVLTEDAQKSQWVAKEVERAINYRKPIVTIEIGDFNLNKEFEMYVSNTQRIKVQKISADSKEFERIIRSVKEYT